MTRLLWFLLASTVILAGDEVSPDIKLAEERGYRVELKLSGNQILSDAEITSTLGVKSGDQFSARNVRKGLERLQPEYGRRGYINFTPIPDAFVDHGQQVVRLSIELDEGPLFTVSPHYEIIGATSARINRIRKWLDPVVGKPFDMSWWNRVSLDRKLLPECVRREHHINQNDATVTLVFDFRKCDQ